MWQYWFFIYCESIFSIGGTIWGYSCLLNCNVFGFVLGQWGETVTLPRHSSRSLFPGHWTPFGKTIIGKWSTLLFQTIYWCFLHPISITIGKGNYTIGMPNHLFLVAELASIGMTLVRHLVAVSSVLAPVIAPVAVVKGKRFRLIGILTGERINQYDSIVMAVASKKEKSLSFLACGNYFYLWVGDFCACSWHLHNHLSIPERKL